jgi:polyhydroxyalkanoate synthesis regulator phasin
VSRSKEGELADAVQSLTDTLTKKGVLTKEEAAAINRRAPVPPAP